MKLLPLLLLIISCSNYKTPDLPNFSDDKLSYDKIMQQNKLLQDKIKKNRELNN